MLVLKLRIINGKEALAFLRNPGFHTSDTTWYREKNKLEKMKLKRLNYFEKTGFEE